MILSVYGKFRFVSYMIYSPGQGVDKSSADGIITAAKQHVDIRRVNSELSILIVQDWQDGLTVSSIICDRLWRRKVVAFEYYRLGRSTRRDTCKTEPLGRTKSATVWTRVI